MATITVNPGEVVARLSGAMNGAGMEELNHEIYGGVFAQLIHGESFEEPAGEDGGGRPICAQYSHTYTHIHTHTPQQIASAPMPRPHLTVFALSCDTHVRPS